MATSKVVFLKGKESLKTLKIRQFMKESSMMEREMEKASSKTKSLEKFMKECGKMTRKMAKGN